MDNQKIQAAVLATVASVLAVGTIILEDIRSRRFIIRQPRVNRDYEREGFISDILHRGDARCSFTGFFISILRCVKHWKIFYTTFSYTLPNTVK